MTSNKARLVRQDFTNESMIESLAELSVREQEKHGRPEQTRLGEHGRHGGRHLGHFGLEKRDSHRDKRVRSPREKERQDQHEHCKR